MIAWLIYCLIILYCANPCPAELLQLYFLSFEAGMLTRFPASNDEKYYYLWKIDMYKIKLLDQQSVY